MGPKTNGVEDEANERRGRQKIVCFLGRIVVRIIMSNDRYNVNK